MTEQREVFSKSSLCDTGTCVEVSIGEVVLVRNSSAPEKRVEFTREEWRTFVAGVRSGEFEIH